MEITKNGVMIKVRCPTCESKNIIFRKKDKVFWCRKCGQHFRVYKSGLVRRISDKKKGAK